MCRGCVVEVGEKEDGLYSIYILVIFFSSSPLPSVFISVIVAGPSLRGMVLAGEGLVFLYECRYC